MPCWAKLSSCSFRHEGGLDRRRSSYADKPSYLSLPMACPVTLSTTKKFWTTFLFLIPNRLPNASRTMSRGGICRP